jgi:hypothetical protein
MEPWAKVWLLSFWFLRWWKGMEAWPTPYSTILLWWCGGGQALCLSPITSHELAMGIPMGPCAHPHLPILHFNY